MSHQRCLHRRSIKGAALGATPSRQHSLSKGRVRKAPNDCGSHKLRPKLATPRLGPTDTGLLRSSAELEWVVPSQPNLRKVGQAWPVEGRMLSTAIALLHRKELGGETVVSQMDAQYLIPMLPKNRRDRYEIGTPVALNLLAQVEVQPQAAKSRCIRAGKQQRAAKARRPQHHARTRVMRQQRGQGNAQRSAVIRRLGEQSKAQVKQGSTGGSLTRPRSCGN